jgi:hypothetical protein
MAEPDRSNPYAAPGAPILADLLTQRVPRRPPRRVLIPWIVTFSWGCAFLFLAVMGWINMGLEARRTGWRPLWTQPRSLDLVLLTVGALMSVPGSLILAGRNKWIAAVALGSIGTALCVWLVILKWLI